MDLVDWFDLIWKWIKYIFYSFIGLSVLIIISPLTFSDTYYFILNNYYAFGGIIFFILSYVAWEFLREHPAEKIYQSYKEGRIKRQQAVTRIIDSMYHYSPSTSPPPAYKSEIMARRLNSLTKRVKAEQEFTDELFKYMKSKARLGG